MQRVYWDRGRLARPRGMPFDFRLGHATRLLDRGHPARPLEMPSTSDGEIQRVYWDRGRPARPLGMPFDFGWDIQRVYWDRGRDARGPSTTGSQSKLDRLVQ